MHYVPIAKQHALVLLFFSFCLTPFLVRSDTRDSFDDLIAFVDNDITINNLISNSSTQTVRQVTKPDVINLLDELGVPLLLQENFFLRTNNLNTRSLLDYPEFIPWRHDRDKHAVYVDLFFNQMSRMHFNRDSSNICSYLAVSQDSFLSTLATIIDNAQLILPEGTTLDTDAALRVLQLFQTFTVQQRRFGFMVGGKASFNRWYLNIMAPLYYLERNHYVDEAVSEDIEDLVTDIVKELGGETELSPAEKALAEKGKDTFIYNHLICDMFGIGDTRVYLDYPIIKKNKMWTRLGLMATIPTAFSFKKGLLGTSLSRAINRPKLDLINLVEGATAPVKSVSEQSVDFALAALDNFGAMVLEPEMGNGGHFGIGLMFRNRSPLSNFIKMKWARRVTMRSFLTLEYQFPSTEWRSFRIPVNEALFNARNLNEIDNPLIVNSNFDFIINQLTDRLFPIALRTRVNPGVLFHWSSLTVYEGDMFGFSLGTDTYVRNKEHFSHIDAPDYVKRMIDQTDAKASLSYQAKMFGSLFCKINKPDKFFTISLFGDTTYMFKGIGSDFSITLNVDCAF